MNLQLYEPANAAIVALQARLIELNPRARRRTKAELVAWAIEEGLTEYHTSDKLLQTIRADQPVWVRVDLSETAINAVHNIAEAISYENAYNALAKLGAKRILQNLKQKAR